MTTLYIDTNIIIDAVEGRKNKFGKDIGNPAADLFLEAISCKYNVIISSWTMYELSRHKTLEQTHILFLMLEKKIIHIEHTEEDIKNAKSESPEHFQDALHAILAIKSHADCLVTRNTEDFVKFKEKVKIAKPEELF